MTVDCLVHAQSVAEGVVDGADGGRSGALRVRPGSKDPVTVPEPLVTDLVTDCVDFVVRRHLFFVFASRLVLSSCNFSGVSKVGRRGSPVRLRSLDKRSWHVDEIPVMSTALGLLSPWGRFVEGVVQGDENVTILGKRREREIKLKMFIRAND